MKIHELKCWPEPFRAMQEGVKTFEFRKDDRGFEVGDELVLREWSPYGNDDPGVVILDPQKGDYTGRGLSRRVRYILRGPAFGVPADYVIMAVVP